MNIATEQFWSAFAAHSQGGPAPWALNDCYSAVASRAPPVGSMSVITIKDDAAISIIAGFARVDSVLARMSCDGFDDLVDYMGTTPPKGTAWVLLIAERKPYTSVISLEKGWS